MSAARSRLLPIAMAVAFLVTCAVYLIYTWDRLVFSVLLVEIRHELQLPLSSLGLLASIFTAGLAIMAIPAGLLAVRFGNKWTLALGALVFSACTLYTAFGRGFADILLVRVGSGIGEGLYNVAFFTFLGALSVKMRGALIGVGASLFGIGTFTGPLVTAYLLHATGGWRPPFIVLGLLGLIGVATIWVALRGHGKATVAAHKVEGWSWQGLWSDLLTRRVLAVALLMIVNGFGVYSYIAIFETYLRTQVHFGLAEASFIFGVFGIGNIVGGLPAGVAADVIGRRLTLVVAAAASGLLALGLYAFAASPTAAVVLAFFFGLTANSIYTNCYAFMQDQVRPDNMAIGTGVLATIYYSVSGFAGFIIVVVAGATGWTPAALWLYTIPYLVVAGLMWVLGSGRRTESPAAAPQGASH